MIRFGFATKLNAIYLRNLIVGDTENPSFILKDGNFLLFEIHTAGGPEVGPFYGGLGVQASTRSAMSDLRGRL